MASGAPALNFFQPDVQEDDDTNEIDVISKSIMVSPTEDQFTLLHSRLRERLLQGETIYEIGTGGKYRTYPPFHHLSWSETLILRQDCISYSFVVASVFIAFKLTAALKIH